MEDNIKTKKSKMKTSIIISLIFSILSQIIFVFIIQNRYNLIKFINKTFLLLIIGFTIYNIIIIIKNPLKSEKAYKLIRLILFIIIGFSIIIYFLDFLNINKLYNNYSFPLFSFYIISFIIFHLLLIYLINNHLKDNYFHKDIIINEKQMDEDLKRIIMENVK